MSDVAIHIDHVWKKFRKGELHDSLRELLPAAFKRLVGRGPRRDELAGREFWALKDVSFDVAKGESIGIIGPNGAGKSTMLKLLSRILKPNRGSFRINGRVSALIEVGAGFHPDLTGRENIYLSGTILGMRRREIREKEQRIIEFSGVESFIDTPVKRYSSGMTARLGFAIASHMDPDVLLVDEVLSVGDARFRQKCIARMKSLIESEVTVVFITHLLDQVRALCPNTVVLDRGQVVFHGPTTDAIGKYLEVLASNEPDQIDPATLVSEIRAISIRDRDGREALRWRHDDPAIVEFELVNHLPDCVTHVQLNISSIDGVYLGTALSSRAGAEIPKSAGTHRVRYTLDPLPLGDGAYNLDFQVFGFDHNGHFGCVWSAPNPRAVSVYGADNQGSRITCDGHWQIVKDAPTASTPRAVGQP
ncbi:MAG: ABC transporter ATP-binding protein [Phycisphaeraceae bacterium]|nr:ABC transporter ATP-binding protein [Phycisphaeraceae bacterium]